MRIEEAGEHGAGLMAPSSKRTRESANRLTAASDRLVRASREIDCAIDQLGQVEGSTMHRADLLRVRSAVDAWRYEITQWARRLEQEVA